MQTARMVVDPAFRIAEVDERIFGSFVEHMGRARLRRHLRAGPPDRRRGRLPRRRAGADARARRHRRRAIPAATSSPPTTGRTASARASGARRASTSRGARSRRTRSGTDEFMRWARKAGRRADVRGQPRHPRRRRGAQPRRVLQRARGQPLRRPARGERRMPTRTAIRLWCLGNEMDGPWQIGHKTAGRVRPARRRGRQGDAPRRPVDRARAWSAARTPRCRRSARGRTRCSTSPGTWPTTSPCTRYYDPADYDGVDAYLACSLDLDRMIDTVVATARRRGRAQAQPQAHRLERRRVERLAPAGQPAPHGRHRPVQARAAARRGRPHDGRRRSSSAACSSRCCATPTA